MTDVITQELEKRKRIASFLVIREDVQKLAGLVWEEFYHKIRNMALPYKIDQIVIVDIFEYLNPQEAS